MKGTTDKQQGDPEAPIGETIGDGYRIERLCRSDSLGHLYEASTSGAGSDRFAVLIFHAELADDDAVLKRFQASAKPLRSLDDPHTAAVLELGRTSGGQPFLISAFPQGRTLAEVVGTEGKLKPGHAVHLFRHVAQALAAAHLKRVVHHDVRPENIVVSRNGGRQQYILMGFGASPFKAASLKTSAQRSEAPYVAPEQVGGRPADHRADVFSAGAVLYTMVTGRPPVDPFGEGDVPPPRSLDGRIPDTLDEIIVRAMAQTSSDRYGFMNQMDVELLPLDDESGDLMDEVMSEFDAAFDLEVPADQPHTVPKAIKVQVPDPVEPGRIPPPAGRSAIPRPTGSSPGGPPRPRRASLGALTFPSKPVPAPEPRRRSPVAPLQPQGGLKIARTGEPTDDAPTLRPPKSETDDSPTPPQGIAAPMLPDLGDLVDDAPTPAKGISAPKAPADDEPITVPPQGRDDEPVTEPPLPPDDEPVTEPPQAAADEAPLSKPADEAPLSKPPDEEPLPEPPKPADEEPRSKPPSSATSEPPLPSGGLFGDIAPESDKAARKPPAEDQAPSSEAPSSKAPSSKAPSSEAPSSEAPSSEDGVAAAPPSDAAPSPTAPRSRPAKGSGLPLLIGAGIALGVVIAGGWALFGRPPKPAVSSTPTATQPPRQAPSASSTATATVTAVASDPKQRVEELREQLLKGMRTAQHDAAFSALDEMVTLDHEVVESVLDEPKARAAVLQLLLLATRLKADKADKVFDQVATGLGYVGPDLLFELHTTKGGSKAAKRAEKLLTDPKVIEKGSEQFRIAYDLRGAKDCDAVHPMLDRAKSKGDHRAQAELERIKECAAGTRCCLRKDSDINEAIDSIGSRLTGVPAAPTTAEPTAAPSQPPVPTATRPPRPTATAPPARTTAPPATAPPATAPPPTTAAPAPEPADEPYE